MTYDDLIILIPSHSLEDFPTDVGEEDASSLLNAFAVAWHPLLLAEAGALPSWHRADDPPEALENRLIIVPTASEEWLQGGWADHARKQGATVITGIADRDKMLQAILEPLKEKSAAQESSPIDAGDPDNSHAQETQQTTQSDSEQSQETGETDPSATETESDEELESENAETGESDPSESEEPPPSDEPAGSPGKAESLEVDPELVADFLALGTCYLQIELLTRNMHHFSNFDEVHLQREAVSAAKAALAHDPEAAQSHLRSCFEVLTEARERFYPVDCYLIDLCLLIPRLAEEPLERTLSTRKPTNILVTAEDLQTISSEKQQVFNSIREGWDAGVVDVIGGEWQERPGTVMPLESVLWDFFKGQRVFRELLQRTPTTWGRRRFGFSTQLPQILNRFGYHSALHLALDDGIYPDAEQSKIRWEGSDGTVVDAITRIPLAADSATSFLRFPMRMAESMEEDQVAAVIWARWPEVQAPWFEDFRRIHNYSPTLGRFVTLEEFFEQTDDPGRLSSFEARDYLSPYLIQSVAREEKNPISRYTDHLQRRQKYDRACWNASMAAILSGQKISEGRSEIEDIIERAGPEAETDTVEQAEVQLKEFAEESSRKLADAILQNNGHQPGYLLVNSLSFPRTVSVCIPELQAPPNVGEIVKIDQFDEAEKILRVKVPPCGFVWFPQSTEAAEVSGDLSESRGQAPLAEGNLLQNRFFEVHINEATGGIGRIKEYGRHPNRLSQQLAFRFPKERTFVVEEDGTRFEEQSYYSEMVCRTMEVTNPGPAVGEITTTGHVVDQTNDSSLAGYRQVFRIRKGLPLVEIEIELDVQTMPAGDPWTNYIASRFAWNDSAASLTRSVHQGAHGLGSERFESLHYLEIASDEERTTILNPNSPYYRKTGPRMVDSLLLVAGETKRKFRYWIAVDAGYPMQAALDAMVPVEVIPTSYGPPPGGNSGWFFSLDVKNVQILSVMGTTHEPPDNLEPWEQHDYERLATANGFALRLLETEGRHRQVKLSCFKTPSRARQRDFQGRTITDLTILDDCVMIDLTAHEIADVELLFDENV